MNLHNRVQEFQTHVVAYIMEYLEQPAMTIFHIGNQFHVLVGLLNCHVLQYFAEYFLIAWYGHQHLEGTHALEVAEIIVAFAEEVVLYLNQNAHKSLCNF